MPNERHYDALVKKHHAIELSISREMKRPLPNTLIIQRLKRQKLLVRDQIESWKRLMHAVRAPMGVYANGLGA